MPSASPLHPPEDVAVDAPVEARPRRCGRCRHMFDGDPALPPAAQQEWWLCPECRVHLFGDAPARDSGA